nr:uncharacterized protein CI109_000864 [Kwoniella shandongensis]KAA5530684.1 hypothetical protein CI109_000864 [Kwoniella shandongensis]
MSSRNSTAVPTATTPLLQPSLNRESDRSAGPSRSTSPSRSSEHLHTLIHRSRSRRRERRRKPISPFTPSIHLIPAIFATVLFLAIALIAWDVSSLGNCYLASLCRVLGDNGEKGWWDGQGPYAPYRSMGKGGGQVGLPRGCEVDQVTLLHRHTARYPTTSAGKCMLRALKKLRNREVKIPRHHPELVFLAKADLELKDWVFDGLMDQGRKAAWKSGVDIAKTYKTFLSHAEGVFTRSSGGGRIVETAGYWLEGFRGDKFKLTDKSKLPPADLVIPEDETFNNTLSVHSCPAFESLSPSPGETAQRSLNPLLEPALSRLNTLLRPQPQLEVDDLICLADMCGYDSQAKGTEWIEWSKWCGIFGSEEWEILGYGKDLKRYYEVGEGSTYGPTMGAGYINEVIARLTDTEPIDSTITNRTLDSDERTFPRGGKRFFVDFGHDNEILEILAAMGILKQHRPLPLDQVPLKRTFILSEIVPFGARLTFERIACDMGNWELDPPTEGDGPDRGNDGRKDYVRILIK